MIHPPSGATGTSAENLSSALSRRDFNMLAASKSNRNLCLSALLGSGRFEPRSLGFRAQERPAARSPSKLAAGFSLANKGLSYLCPAKGYSVSTSPALLRQSSAWKSRSRFRPNKDESSGIPPAAKRRAPRENRRALDRLHRGER